MNRQEWIGGLTRRERRAISVLLMVLIVQISFNRVWPLLVNELSFDYSEFSSEIDQFIKSSQSQNLVKRPVKEVPRFDVNKVSVEELLTYGISEDVAERWLKYGEAIEGFYKLQQIEQIYGIDKDWVYLNRDKFVFQQPKTLTKKHQTKVEVRDFELEAFDINEVSLSDLKAMGFSKRSIEEIGVLRDLGTRFDDKDDVKYLKGMHPKFYEKIEPFIIVDERVKMEEPVKPAFTALYEDDIEVPKKPIVIDVNDSNEFQWQQLSGIGPHFAKSIVKYRNLLGGFVSLDQIKETYNFPDSVYLKIRPYLQLTPITDQIDINTVDVDSLRTHPYIKWKQARIIVNYRDQHGSFSSMDDFYKIRIFDSTFVKRLEPYIVFR